jgi:hypothetical protein
MVLTNAEKQARWRERHISKRRAAQRIVNLLVLKHLTDDQVDDVADLLFTFLNRQGVRALRQRLRELTEMPPKKIAAHNRRMLGDDFSDEAGKRRKAGRNKAEKLAWERDHPGQHFPEHGYKLTPREATDLARWRRRRAKATKQKRAEA